MAPIRVASSNSVVTMLGSTTPLPMVVATCTPKKSTATTLKKAAHATAQRGDSTRVDTTVATELAASFIPLRKSNSSASATMTMIGDLHRAPLRSS